MSAGDVVIVRKQEDIDSGDIAIVLVNGNEATIKKIIKFNGGINLIPSNPAYDVITYTNKEIEELPVRVIGKVVELRAKFWEESQYVTKFIHSTIFIQFTKGWIL